MPGKKSGAFHKNDKECWNLKIDRHFVYYRNVGGYTCEALTGKVG